MSIPAARSIAIVALLWGLVGSGCKDEPPNGPTASRQTSRAPDIIKAAPGSVAAQARVQAARASAEGRQLLVYVGAGWCEPCKRFKDAIKSGSLDAVFPGMRLLEFDLDHDRKRLEEAGYQSTLIPLFVLPGPDGRASERRIEGSVKGPSAVEGNLVPRLKRMLGGKVQGR